MPNHCTNLVTLVGAPAEVQRAVELLRGIEPEYQLSENEKRIFGALKEPEEVKADPFCFHNIIPVPDAVLKAGYDKVGYDWQRHNWGTKWGAYDFDTERLEDYKAGTSEHITYKFDTAWCPPTPVLDALAVRFPELRIYHSYGEEFPTRGYGCWVRGNRCVGESLDEKWPDDHEYLDSHDWSQVCLAQHGEWVQRIEHNL